VADIQVLDFQEILAQPILAYDEGLRFFRGVGLMNATLRRLAKDLKARNIPYCLIGAQALNQHGYQRFTTDIDILMTKEGLAQFNEQLVGRGYRPTFQGATKTFRATEENVPLEIIVSGEYPGDGKPKSVVFPDPSECSIEINGMSTITLEKLVELKLASGMSGAGRLKDLADVQELIRVLNLDDTFVGGLDEYVRQQYLDLYKGVMESRLHNDAPHSERDPNEY
jgi:hypothetical protein